MGNRTVSKLRRNMLLKGGLRRAYGKRARAENRVPGFFCTP